MSEINVFSERVAELGLTGFKQLISNKLGVTKGIIVGLNGTLDFATGVEMSSKTEWETKIKKTKEQRAHVFPWFHSIEDLSQEDQYEESLQGETFARYGKVSFRAMLNVNTYLYRQLQGFSGKDVDVMLIDESMSIIGTDLGGIQGFSASIRIEKLTMPPQGETAKTPIRITLINPEEWLNIAVVEPLNSTTPWNPLMDLDGVYGATVSVSDATAEGCKVKVTKNSIAAGTSGSAVYGLTKDDFILKNSAGIVQTITTLTADGDEYVLVATLASTDTLELVPVADSTLTSLFVEGTNVATITIA